MVVLNGQKPRHMYVMVLVGGLYLWKNTISDSISLQFNSHEASLALDLERFYIKNPLGFSMISSTRHLHQNFTTIPFINVTPIPPQAQNQHVNVTQDDLLAKSPLYSITKRHCDDSSQLRHFRTSNPHGTHAHGPQAPVCSPVRAVTSCSRTQRTRDSPGSCVVPKQLAGTHRNPRKL